MEVTEKERYKESERGPWVNRDMSELSLRHGWWVMSRTAEESCIRKAFTETISFNNLLHSHESRYLHLHVSLWRTLRKPSHLENPWIPSLLHQIVSEHIFGGKNEKEGHLDVVVERIKVTWFLTDFVQHCLVQHCLIVMIFTKKSDPIHVPEGLKLKSTRLSSLSFLSLSLIFFSSLSNPITVSEQILNNCFNNNMK